MKPLGSAAVLSQQASRLLAQTQRLPRQPLVREVSAAASVGASAFGRGVHRTPAPPYSDVADVQIHFLDLRFSLWFFFLEIEIRIVEINDKSEPFANRLRVRICTVWCEYR